MPSTPHEVLVEMFRHRPTLAADMLRDTVDVSIPDYDQAHLSASELNDVNPTEVQRTPDRHRMCTWPVYVATVHARLGCPVVLLAICPDPAVARFYADEIVLRPFISGRPSLTLRPAVVGPHNVPIVTDPEWAATNPELTGSRKPGGLHDHDHTPVPQRLHPPLLRAGRSARSRRG